MLRYLFYLVLVASLEYTLCSPTKHQKGASQVHQQKKSFQLAYTKPTALIGLIKISLFLDFTENVESHDGELANVQEDDSDSPVGKFVCSIAMMHIYRMYAPTKMYAHSGEYM